ncbi:MAG: glycosyl transferase family 1 [Bacteroidetes bacterium]|nr:glycosyl transferase family 1 [Bacteroidota bacterium]
MEIPVRKVLIITYYWPPSGGSGVQRWLKMVKYLRQSGWEPVVYTPENAEYPEIDYTYQEDIPEGVKVIKHRIWEPYSYYKKVLGMKEEEKISAGFLSEKKKNTFLQAVSIWIRGNLFIPDARKFWIRPSVRFLCEQLQTLHIEAIITTGPPHSMHLIGMAIHRKTGIPWLADFCDPWTGIDFYHELNLTYLADLRHKLLEKRVLRSANAVSAVTQTMIQEFNLIFPRKYELISNGFDESDIKPLDPKKMDRKFSIAHIGSLVPSRNPIILWKVLSLLVKENEEFANTLEIKLVGKIDVSVTDSIQKYNLNRYLTKVSYLSHDKAIEETQKSQVLLLLINNTPNARGILTGKLFEYMATRRPILCIGPEDGDAASVLKETLSGKICGYENEDLLKNIVSEYFLEYQKNQLLSSRQEIGHYSWKNLSHNVAKVLNSFSLLH